MTNTQAIIIGAAIIAGSILLTSHQGTAQAMGSGPYQLMHHSNTAANAGVFRVDTSTGGVSYCYINASQIATCTAEVR